MNKKKRIQPIVEENDEEDDAEVEDSNSSSTLQGPMYTIMSNVQMGETMHKKYIKEMKQLYEQMDHDAFMYTLIKLLKTPMVADENNEYAHTTLDFCAKFISSFDSEATHPLVSDIFKWLLSTISTNPHIRFRLCQFVNMVLNALGPEAALDDRICDSILEYMLERLRDTSPNVRLQAIYAMQRLQMPDNPDDPVLRAYQFHLCSDPSPKVRQAVITCMGRNFNTIPYILERLWDIDDKVRRHTYVHMSSYPVRSYKVSQRLTLLEQGLNDRSDGVRKVVSTIMLNQWIESYQKNLIALISALKLDANEQEIDRFRKIAKQMLMEIFKNQPKDDLISCLSLIEEGEFHLCIPQDNLTIENAFYWECLNEYFSAVEADELDFIIPELSVLCNYVQRFCEDHCDTSDNFEQLEFMYKLLSLTEILYRCDLSDIIGRNRLKELLSYLLINYTLDQHVIKVIVKCAENLIEEQNERLQYFVDIIREICDLNPRSNNLINDRSLLEELQASCSEAEQIKISALKVKFMDLEEQEMDLFKEKNYVQAQLITEAKNATIEEFNKLLEKYCNQNDKVRKSLNMNRPVKHETVLQCLQLTYHMIVSTKVKSLNAVACQLYHDFICRHLASNQIIIRDWALKCGTAYSMLYESLSKDVFQELYSQFFKNHNIRLWETSISCIFELLDRYGVDSFVDPDDANKTKKTAGRQLYNTMELLEDDDDRSSTLMGQGVGVVYMMSHFLDTCDDICIIRAIIIGFCRLILRGHITNADIIEKLLLRYFNPTTEPEINQVLGIFMENIIEQRNYGLLQVSLLPTISTVLSAPYDSPLHEIKPETITRFFIDFTAQNTTKANENLHNKIALSFLQEMLNNFNNKGLCKLLAKELTTLEVQLQNNEDLKNEMKMLADKLIKLEFDPRTIKNIINFKDLMDGNFNPPAPARKKGENGDESETDEEDEEDDDENTNSERPTTATSVGSEASEALSINSTKHIEEQLLNDLLQDTDINLVNRSSISIKTPSKTMYGESNSMLHCSLRKSLNLLLTQEQSGKGTKRTLLNTTMSPKSVKRTRLRANRQTEIEKGKETEESTEEKEKDSEKTLSSTATPKRKQKNSNTGGLGKTPRKGRTRNPVNIVNVEIIKRPSRKRNKSISPEKSITKATTTVSTTTTDDDNEAPNVTESNKENNDEEIGANNSEETNANNNKNLLSSKDKAKVPDTNSEQEMENEPEREQQAEPEKVDEPEKIAEPEKVAETERAAEPQQETEPEKVAETVKAAEPEKVAKPQQEAEPEKVAEAERAAEPQQEAEPKKAPEPQQEAEPEKVADPEQKAKPEKVAEAETETEPEIEHDSEPLSASSPPPPPKSTKATRTRRGVVPATRSSTRKKISIEDSEIIPPSQSPLRERLTKKNRLNFSKNNKSAIKTSSIENKSKDSSTKNHMEIIEKSLILEEDGEEYSNTLDEIYPSIIVTHLSGVFELDKSTDTSDENLITKSFLNEKEIIEFSPPPPASTKETLMDRRKLKRLQNSLKENATKILTRNKRNQNINSSKKSPTKEDDAATKDKEILNENTRDSLTSTPIPNNSSSDKVTIDLTLDDSQEELNDSEVIPGSPQNSVDMFHINSSRLRRNVLANSTAKSTTRSLRTRQQTPAAAAAISAIKSPSQQNSTKQGITNEDSPSVKTNLRNRRKRILSPKSSGSPSTPNKETQIVSPIRKQSRLSDEINGIRNKNTATSNSTANSEIGSPSSLKENGNPINQNKNVEITLQITNDPATPPANKAFSSRKTPKSKMKSSQKSPPQNQISTPSLLSKTKVTTRNSARKEQNNQKIMTRKRLSMELNSSFNGGKNSKSPELQPKRKKLKISKIPVISKKLTASTTTNTDKKNSSKGRPPLSSTTSSTKTTLSSNTLSKSLDGNFNNPFIPKSTSNTSTNNRFTSSNLSYNSLSSSSGSSDQQKSKIVIIASIDSNKKNPPSRLPQPTFRK